MDKHRIFAWGMIVGAMLVMLLYWGVAKAGTATLTWTAVTQNTDGTPITFPVTYNVYFGLKGKPKRILTSGLSILTYVDAGLPSGKTYCFTVRAVANNIRSAPSNQGCKTI